MLITVAHWLELKIKWLPMAIEYEVGKQALLRQLGAERYAVRLLVPVRFVELYPMPASNPLADQLS